MARPRTHGTRVTTAIRIPEDLHARLQEVAEERDTSINHLMVRAAAFYLEHGLAPLDAGVPVTTGSMSSG
jgi:predicted transcriptional regulator